MPDKGLHVQQNENVDRGRLQVNVTSTLGLQPTEVWKYLRLMCLQM